MPSIRNLKRQRQNLFIGLDELTEAENNSSADSKFRHLEDIPAEIACTELELYNLELFINQLIWSYINRFLRIAVLAASAAIPVTALSISNPLTAAILGAVVVVLQGVHEILQPDKAVVAHSRARALIYRNILLFRAHLDPYDSGSAKDLLNRVYIEAWEMIKLDFFWVVRKTKEISNFSHLMLRAYEK